MGEINIKNAIKKPYKLSNVRNMGKSLRCKEISMVKPQPKARVDEADIKARVCGSPKPGTDRLRSWKET